MNVILKKDGNRLVVILENADVSIEKMIEGMFKTTFSGVPNVKPHVQTEADKAKEDKSIADATSEAPKLNPEVKEQKAPTNVSNEDVNLPEWIDNPTSYLDTNGFKALKEVYEFAKTHSEYQEKVIPAFENFRDKFKNVDFTKSTPGFINNYNNAMKAIFEEETKDLVEKLGILDISNTNEVKKAELASEYRRLFSEGLEEKE